MEMLTTDDFDHEANRRCALAKVAKSHWEDLARICWEGYQEEGRGFYMVNQPANREQYNPHRHARKGRGSINMVRLLAREKGVNAERLARQLRGYDPKREIVTLLIPSDAKLRRTIVPKAPQHAEKMMNLDSGEVPVSGVFSHDPPPRSFGSEHVSDLADNLDRVASFFGKIAGSGEEKA